jgi:hypothetical protein
MLTSSLLACTTFGPVPAHDFITAKRPGEIWITDTRGSVVKLEHPGFAGDTLVGFVNNKYREFLPQDVAVVRAHQPAPGRTAVLVVGGVAVVTAAALVLKRSGNCQPVGSPGFDESSIC